MKRTKITSLGVALGIMLTLASCYEDKGNYDYSFDSLNEIKGVSFTPASVTSLNGQKIEFSQPLEGTETKRVEVSVDQTLGTGIDNLAFQWARSYTDADGKTVKDTLTTAGYLDVEIPSNRLMEYYVLLKVKDKTTDLAYYTRLYIKTRPIFQNSLFVLHTQQGETKLGNIETIGADTNISPDAYKTVNPDANDNPFSNSIGMDFQAMYDLGTRGTIEEFAVFNSNGTSSIYNPFGLSKRDDLYPYFVLPRLESSEQPFIADKLTVAGDYSATYNDHEPRRILISKDGRFYVADQYLSYHIPGEAVHTEDYPDHLTPDMYSVSIGVVTFDKNLLWDKRGNRFIYQGKEFFGSNETYVWQSSSYNPVLDAHVSFDDLGSALSPVGKTAVFAYIYYKSSEDYSKANPFFVFKDSDGQYYIYELTYTGSDDTDKKSSSSDDDEATAMYTITGKAMSNFTPSSDKTIAYSTQFSTNYLFYANGGNLYRYNTSSGDNTLLYSAPYGYTITLVKPRSYDAGTFTADLGRYLVLALSDGNGHGAVAEVCLNTSADVESILPSATTVYEGFGNILDLQFVHEYNYTTQE